MVENSLVNRVHVLLRVLHKGRVSLSVLNKVFDIIKTIFVNVNGEFVGWIAVPDVLWPFARNSVVVERSARRRDGKALADRIVPVEFVLLQSCYNPQLGAIHQGNVPEDGLSDLVNKGQGFVVFVHGILTRCFVRRIPRAVVADAVATFSCIFWISNFILVKRLSTFLHFRHESPHHGCGKRVAVAFFQMLQYKTVCVFPANLHKL